jgi:3-oxoacyl-[acyl-carrier-protein] synthase-1
MSLCPLAVLSTGMVAPVGLSAPAACAAIRAGLANPSQTRFVISSGESLSAHVVPLEQPWRGLEKLARMAAQAIEECLDPVPREDWGRISLLLCVAEQTRPGRLEDLDDLLLEQIQEKLVARFSSDSYVLPHGRVSIALALQQARRLVYEREAYAALIVATDSLLTWPTLRVYDRNRRLLSGENPNGFIPGEGACAVLVGPPAGGSQLHVEGIGFAMEPAHIDSEQPLRGDGLTGAIVNALNDAGREMHDMDFRITDISGESYYFKEAALALARTHRRRPDVCDIWHPAECIGEAGSVIGPAMLAVLEAACRKEYAPGATVLLHAANDAGQRAAIVARYGANG